MYSDCDQHFRKSQGLNQRQRTCQTTKNNHTDSKDTKKTRKIKPSSQK